MKEKGPFRQAFETAGKVWTIVSIPVELFLLSHGITTGNKIEAIAGAVGLIGDFFTWEWLSRDKRDAYKKLPISMIAGPRGSARFINS